MQPAGLFQLLRVMRSIRATHRLHKAARYQWNAVKDKYKAAE